MLTDLRWRGDRAYLGEIEFIVHHRGAPAPETSLSLYKTEGLLLQYRLFFERIHPFSAAHILEIGTWDGGSAVLWFDHFAPEKLVTVDASPPRDTPCFDAFRRSRCAEPKLVSRWGVDQGDPSQLLGVLAEEELRPIDLVFDDASHLYEETKVAFDVVFPTLRPGGYYIIEDWGRSLLSRTATKKYRVVAADPGDVAPEEYAGRLPLERLIHELVSLVGCCWLIASVVVHQGFVAVERGGGLVEPGEFSIDAFLAR